MSEPEEDRQLWRDHKSVNIEMLRAELKQDTRRFGLQLFIGFAATVAATATVTTVIYNYLGHTQPPPQTIIIQQKPPSTAKP